eukprot:403357335
MDQFKRMQTQTQQAPTKESLLAQSQNERGGIFNFDMNEEFSPSLAKYHKPKEQSKKPKKKKILRLDQLPLEITQYNRAAINFLYILVLFVGIVTNMDQGTLAGASIQIKNSMNIDNMQFGGLLSVTYVGIFIGQILNPIMISFISEKMLILISLTFSTACLLLLTVSEVYYVSIIAKLFQGFFQIQLLAFFPIWIETFGSSSSQKTSWLSIYLMSPFFSYILGYLLTGLLVTNNFEWKVMYYAQCCLIMPCFVAFLFTPDKYNDIDEALKLKRQKDEQQKQVLKQNPIEENVKVVTSYDVYRSFGNIGVLTSKQQVQYQPLKSFNNDDLIRDQNEQLLLQHKNSLNVPQEISKKDQIKKLFQNNSFIFFSLSIIGYFYLVTGIQLWITDYAQQVLKTEASQIYLWFSIIFLVSPLTGAIVSSIISKQVGGSSSPQALGVLCFASFCSTVVALPIPFIINFAAFSGMLAALLFLLGLILPILIGQLQYTLYQEQRIIANSFNNYLYLMLAFTAAPTAYGFMSRYTEGQNHYSLGVIIYSTVISSAFLFIALISKLNYRQNQRYLKYSDPDSYQKFQRNQNSKVQQNPLGYYQQKEFRSGESILNELAQYNTAEEEMLMHQQRYNNMSPGPMNGYHPQNTNESPLAQRLGHGLMHQVQRQARAHTQNNGQKRQLYLTNIDRLKYESSHVLNGKLFIPTVIGIVNEDFYI